MRGGEEYDKKSTGIASKKMPKVFLPKSQPISSEYFNFCGIFTFLLLSMKL